MRMPYLPFGLPYAPSTEGWAAARTPLAVTASGVRLGASMGEQTVMGAQGQATTAANGYSVSVTRCNALQPSQGNRIMSTSRYIQAAVAYDATARSAGFGMVAGLALALYREANASHHPLSAMEVLTEAARVLGAESESVGKTKAGDLQIKAYYTRAAKTAMLRGEELIAATIRDTRGADKQVAALAATLESRFGTLRSLNGVQPKASAKKATTDIVVFRLLSKITAYAEADGIAQFAALRAAFLNGDAGAKAKMDAMLATAVNPRLATLRAVLDGNETDDGAEADEADEADTADESIAA